MFTTITDPVKKAEAELDVLMAELKANAPAQVNAGNPADAAPAVAGTPAAGSADATTQATQNPGDTAAATQQSQPEDAAYWRNRCDVVLGKYNSEVPRLSAELANVKRQLSELQAVKATTPATAVADGDDYRSPHVNDEIRASRSYLKMAKEFGADYAETHFEGAALSAKQAARAEMQPMQDQMALSATDRLHADIARQSPNWMTTNDDPKFIAWAQSNKEPYSGMTVIDLLNNAYKSGDAGRVAAIFNDYNQKLTSTSTTTDTSGLPSADDLVAPNRRGSSAQTNADLHQGKIWTEVEIDKFYDDHSRGRYENRQKEAKEIEAEISRAYKEGRVRQ